MTSQSMQAGLEQRTDEQLMRAFRKGDQAGFDLLFRRHERQLIGYLFNFTGELEFSKDICQEAFLKLINRPPLFCFKNSIKPWLFRVARNLALDQMKRRKFHAELDDEQEFSSNQPSPAQAFQQEDDFADLRNHVNSLPDELRDIVCQRIYAKLSFKEIAKISSIPLGTALWRMQRALKELKHRLREAGYEH